MKNKNSILILTERFYPEEFGINDLALDWVKKGYNVTVLTQAPSYPFDKIFDGYSNKVFQKENWNGIKIYRVKTRLGYQLSRTRKVISYLHFAIYSSFFSIFLHRKFNKIFVYQVGPLTQIIAGLFLKFFFKKELYLWILDIWPDTVFAYGFKKNKLNTFILNLFVKKVYNSCNHILVSNIGFIDSVSKIYNTKKISFIPQWVPLDLNFTNISSNSVLPETFNFTFAGNIGMVQNLENLIIAFGKINNLKSARFNIIGDGSNLKNLKQLATNLGIKNIHFLGRKPITEMPAWLIASDVLIISLINKPNFSITVPAKFQAYLAAGKPIFCCMYGETAKLVNNFELGLTCKPDEIEDITNTFDKFILLTNEQMMNFSQNSKQLIETQYKFNIVQSKINQIVFH
jgi:glycosyltransferase involved in cell wall biosynthesis